MASIQANSAMVNLGDDEDLSPSLQNVLDQKSLKWVFVGGKGGVGKTTTSCSVGVMLSKVRNNVLIISTDPAHNLSDAFKQKFSGTPALVEGYSNLSCMEVEPGAMNLEGGEDVAGLGEAAGGLTALIKEFSGTMPGIDEAMSFAEIMKNVENMDYDCIVFDTAPTGHTLRLLSFPTMLEKAMDKVMELKNKMGGMAAGLASMMGGQAGAEDAMMEKLTSTRETVQKVNKQFQDPDLTTFICVCIPEFLSLYETERLIQELTKFGIDTHNIVVNQVLFAEPDACRKFLARTKMQNKYLDQIHDLYEDFNVTIMPMRDEEVRGSDKLEAFGRNLIEPYQPPTITDVMPPVRVVIEKLAKGLGKPEEELYELLLEQGLNIPKSS